MNPIVEKVKKLLALAGSSNEHEARAALAKAMALMEEHSLSQADVAEAQKGQFTRTDVDAFGDIDFAMKLAANICTHFFNVEICYTEGGIIGKQLAFLGREENVQVAEYVFEFLRQLFARIPKAERVGKQETPDFQKGMYDGLFAKLKEEKLAKEITPTGGGENLPMVAERQALARFMRQQFPRAHGAALGNGRAGNAYESGVAKGREINIRQGVTSAGTTKAYLT